MVIKGLVDEDFIQYKKPSMFIATSKCDWKCCIEVGKNISMCQNQPISLQKNMDISADEIFRRYISNPITESVVFGGLEPILQFDEVLEVITTFRNNKCFDDIIIYTGYYPDEIKDKINILKQYKNIIIKFGRYIPEQEFHEDKVLGVKLASNNQFSERIS